MAVNRPRHPVSLFFALIASSVYRVRCNTLDWERLAIPNSALKGFRFKPGAGVLAGSPREPQGPLLNIPAGRVSRSTGWRAEL